MQYGWMDDSGNDTMTGTIPKDDGMRGNDRQPRLTVGLSGTNLVRVSDFNQRVVLQAIRVGGGKVSRSELAAATGLTFPTIANITRRLIEGGLVHETARIKGRRGSPASRLAIDPDGCFSLGVNIDRDHVAVVILDLAGGVRARHVEEVDFPSPALVVDFVHEWYARTADALNLDRERFIGIGLAIPDDIGTIALPKMPESYGVWATTNVSSMLQERLGLPVLRDNDAAAAAIGEAQFGNGRRFTDFFYVLISAGLGGAVVVDNEYVRGGNGRAGELGLLPADFNHPAGPTVQDCVSLSELRLRLERAGYEGSVAKLRADVERHNPVVRDWSLEAAKTLTLPILTVNALLNPTAIFIGARLPSCLLDSLILELNRNIASLGSAVPNMALIQRASHDEDAVAIGAAILPFIAHTLPSHAALMKNQS